MHVIHKKRKNGLIRIPNILNNILLHLYNESTYYEVNKYCNVSKLWDKKLLHFYDRGYYLEEVERYEWFFRCPIPLERILGNTPYLLENRRNNYLDGEDLLRTM
jgi:hypothetical protein